MYVILLMDELSVTVCEVVDGALVGIRVVAAFTKIVPFATAFGVLPEVVTE